MPDSANGYIVSMSPLQFQIGSHVEVITTVLMDTPTFRFNGAPGKLIAITDGNLYELEPPRSVTSGMLEGFTPRGELGNPVKYVIDPPASNVGFNKCTVNLEGAILTRMNYVTKMLDTTFAIDTVNYTATTIMMSNAKSVGDTVMIEYDYLIPCMSCLAHTKNKIIALLDTSARLIKHFELSDVQRADYVDEDGEITASIVCHDIPYTLQPNGSIAVQIPSSHLRLLISKFERYQVGGGGLAGTGTAIKWKDIRGLTPSAFLKITLSR
jgi:hypothetical protein